MFYCLIEESTLRPVLVHAQLGFEETTPPSQKKPTVDGTALSATDPQSIAQAAIAK